MIFLFINKFIVFFWLFIKFYAFIFSCYDKIILIFWLKIVFKYCLKCFVLWKGYKYFEKKYFREIKVLGSVVKGSELFWDIN